MKSARAYAIGTALAACVSLSAGVGPPAWGAATCAFDTVATDSTRGQGSVALFFGKALGQTFVASDTLIRSIAVWQPPADYYEHINVWVCRTRADQHADLINGLLWVDSRYFNQADPHLEYVFDPPLALPGPGLYAFFFQDACGTDFALRYNVTDNLYPAGHLWRTGRTIGFGCYIDPATSYYAQDENADLIFAVTFCSGTVTAVRATTWGRLKTIYR